MSKKNVVGIDLGTSFSSIARLDSYGRPEVLPNAEGEQMTPSVVYFGADGVIFGNEALKSGSDDPARLVENAKRELGTSFLGWEIDEVFYSPVDIGAYILGKLKSDAEEQIGPIDGAVISVPVHFSIQQRELTIEAAQRVGLEVLGLVNEPVAAGLTYILGENGLAYVSLADEQTILVYDLGGGTFDLSIVHYGADGIDVKAAAGDMRLGGIDFNSRLLDIIVKSIRDRRGVDVRGNVKLMRKLNENIESAKRSLSNPNKPFTNLTLRLDGAGETFKITREEFEKATEDLVERTRTLTESLVKSSVRRWDLIQQVLPVGGASRMPMIREAVRKMCLKTMGEVFGLEPNYRLSPDLAIAQGAALYAGLLAGHGPEDAAWARAAFIPKMASSRGLGLAVRNADGERVNHILIAPNTPLPASVSLGVETVKPDQQRINLKIVEAEDEQYRDEDVLLRCEINNLPENLPEGSAFDLDLTYEASGLLQIVAIHRETGRIATSRLKRDTAAMEPAAAPIQPAAPLDELSEPERPSDATEPIPALMDSADTSSPASPGKTDPDFLAAASNDFFSFLDAPAEEASAHSDHETAAPFILNVVPEEKPELLNQEPPVELEVLDDIELLPLEQVEEVKPPPFKKKKK